MKKIIAFLLLCVLHFTIFLNLSFANIDITVSPIKYDLTIEKGQSDTKSVKIFNNTDSSQEIFVTTRNAVSMEDNGQPVFVEEINNPELYLANWVTPSITNFVIGAGENLDIPFTINIPTNATPGGHYGSIFFNVKENAGGQITIQKRIGVLLLVKIPGEVDAVGEIKDIKIVVNSDGGGWAGSKNDKSNLIGKLFKRYVLGEKEKNIELVKDDSNNENDNNLDLSSAGEKDINDNKSEDKDNDKDFGVDLTIDFENIGNTHLKPTGKIEIVDDEGTVLKKIGKETIKNEAGAIVGEKVVDYIPINDENGNVLPNENRKFKQNWNGFAYETIDENGKKVIKYYTPSEYYSTKNKQDKGYLMPWEKVNTKEVNKKLTAKISLEYIDPEGKEVEFNSARDFYVSYNEDYIGLNWYIITPAIIFIILLLSYFILLACRRKKCPNCKRKVSKDMHICPYCGEKLKKKNTKKED